MIDAICHYWSLLVTGPNIVALTALFALVALLCWPSQQQNVTPTSRMVRVKPDWRKP